MLNHNKTSLTNALSGKGDPKRPFQFDDDDEDEKASYKKMKQDVDLSAFDDDLDDKVVQTSNIKSYNHNKNDDIEDFSDEENNTKPTNSNPTKNNTNDKPINIPQKVASSGNKSSSKDGTPSVKWFWKSDSDWVEYEAEMASKLEQEWLGSKRDVRVDQERFIDVKYMLQRRYDAPMKVRQVKREAVAKPHGNTLNSANNPPTTKNFSYNSSNIKSNNTISTNKPSFSTNTNNATTKPSNVSNKNSNVSNKPSNVSNKPQNDKTSASGDSSTVRWYWMNDKNDWEEYDAKVSSKLEKKYLQKQTNIQIDNDRYVDLKMWSQRRYDDPKKMRKIKRDAPGPSKQSNTNNNSSGNASSNNTNNNNTLKQNKSSGSNTASPAKNSSAKGSSDKSQNKQTSGVGGNVIWLWQEDNDTWIKYDKATSVALELAYSQGSSEGRVDDERYVDFESMLQRRFDNQNKKRYVKRQVQLTDADKARIEKNRQEALKKLVNKNPNMSHQPKIYSFWAKSSSQSTSQPSDKSNNTDNKQNTTKPHNNEKKNSFINKNANDEENDNNNNNNDKNSNDGSDTEEPIQNKETIELSDSSEDEATDEKTRLDKKRQKYACGDDYITLSQLNSWEVSLLRLKTESDPSSPYHGNANNENYNKVVSLWQGDITTLEIAAIVNAAKPSLLGGGGIDGAIHKAAGKGLVNECKLMYPDGCEVGEARITGGHRLPAEYVIHTVGPVGENNAKLRSCYEASLDLMKQCQLRTIAFCCVSTGIYGFPNKKAALVALRTVREWLDKNGTDSVDRIVFCVFLEKDFTIYSNYMPYFFPPALTDGGDGDGGE